MLNAKLLLALLVAAIVLAVGSFFYGKHVAGLACEVRVAALVHDYDTARAKAAEKAEADRAALAARNAASDALRTKELTDAQTQIDALRADVADGRKRLLVNAKCPATASVPKAGSSARVDDAAAARLEGSAEQDYYTLVGRLELMEAQLKALQDRERARQENAK